MLFQTFPHSTLKNIWNSILKILYIVLLVTANKTHNNVTCVVVSSLRRTTDTQPYSGVDPTKSELQRCSDVVSTLASKFN